MVTKEEAISWMRGEIRLLRMGPLVNNGWVNPDWQKEIEIYELAIAALEKEENTDGRGDWNSVAFRATKEA